MKNFLKSVYHRLFGKKANFWIHHWLKWEPAQNSIEHILSLSAPSIRKAVQVGSNDGFSGDPLYRYIITNRWRAILVEVDPRNFRKLQHLHRKNARVLCKNIAIDAEKGVRTFYTVHDKTGKAPQWVNQLGSFNRDVILKSKGSVPWLESCIEEVKVETDTFMNIVAENDFADLDLIHIDTEGYDYEIIKTINFGVISPRVVMFEHRHLSEANRDAINVLFERMGYRRFSDKFDTLYFRELPVLLAHGY